MNFYSVQAYSYFCGQSVDKFNIDGHKMQYHLERTAQWLRAKTINEKLNVFPIYLEISPVGHCNHRCTFCAVDYIGYKPRSLQTELLKERISEMASAGVRSIMFAGEGEPLLHNQLPELINHTKQQGIDVAVTTNGTQLSQAFIEKCMHSITWLKISVNGGTMETYAKIHQTKEADFDKVWNNLATACLYRELNGIKCTIGIQSVLLPDNINTVEDLVVDAKHCGLDYVVIKPYSQHHKSITTLYKDIKYGNALNMAAELAKHNTESFEVVTRYISMQNHDSDERGYSKCYSTPFLWAYIMATGDVYGCSAYLLDKRFCYGNINEKSFVDIWTGEQRKTAIDFVENSLDITECRKNCRMDKVNRYLWDIKNPQPHENFI